MKLPQRVSMVAQVVAVLRDALLAGRWSKQLPSERTLADQLQVSRFSIRHALRALQSEGFIELKKRRYQVKSLPAKRLHPVATRLVVMLSTEPLHTFDQAKLMRLDELRRHLHNAGYTFEVRTDGQLQRPGALAYLQRIVKQTPAACWLLNWSTREAQQWFSSQGLPAIIMGTRYQGVDLPAIDFDYRAVCMHAAATFWRLGHRRVAYVALRLPTAGNLASKEGFLKGISREAAAEFQVVEHPGTAVSIQRVMLSLFEEASPPTGLFVSHALHCLTVMTLLARLGRNVPKHVSLILRQDDPIMDYVLPRVTAYKFSNTRSPVQLARMVAQLVESGTVGNRQILIPGELQAGESVGAPPP